MDFGVALTVHYGTVGLEAAGLSASPLKCRVPSPQSPIPNPQSPVPNPQSPIPNLQSPVPSQSPIPSPQSQIPSPQFPPTAPGCPSPRQPGPPQKHSTQEVPFSSAPRVPMSSLVLTELLTDAGTLEEGILTATAGTELGWHLSSYLTTRCVCPRSY